MAHFRLPGALCGWRMAFPLDEGTSAQTWSTVPGTICITSCWYPDGEELAVTGGEPSLFNAAKVADRLSKPWSVSDELLPFLAIWENGIANGKNFASQTVVNGFILTVYEDSRKLPTVGCGHLVVAADKLKLGDKISIDQAKKFLKSDLATAEKAINSKVTVVLYQYEYDALVSIAFNTGATGVTKLVDFVNTEKYVDVPAAIEKYYTGGGNTGRRASEAKLFKSGVYDATH